MSILERIVEATRMRVERQKARQSAPLSPHALCLPPFAFERALRQPGMSFICEVKKASPSKGVIDPVFPYRVIAQQYQTAGATAISVLTEPDFFLGNDEYLREIRGEVSIPLLRKDFMIDPWQIEQARALGADAVLLICSVLTSDMLREFITRADRLGLSCLVEVHDESELDMAVKAGARVIGVNNRDLKTFKVDIDNSLRLRKLAPDEAVFVAESGITGAGDIVTLRSSRIDAALIGEALMRAPDKAKALAQLRGEKL